MPTTTGATVRDVEISAEHLNVSKAAAIYREHGCLLVRGLMRKYVDRILDDVEATARQSISLLDRAEKIPEGWRTPDGTLFIPAPSGFQRDKQIMVLAISYRTSAAFFQSAWDEPACGIVEAILGPDVELFGEGQSLYKEPVGGHPKHLHQDGAYFEHRYEGPVGILSYLVPTDLKNGCLHVVPGSHRLGILPHVDTFSHLGLEEDEWPWEKALPLPGQPGDSIFFHVKTIHGSKENHADKARPVFIHRYRRPDDYVVVSATSAAARAEAEKRIAQASKENQKGFMVRGRRRYAATEMAAEPPG